MSLLTQALAAAPAASGAVVILSGGMDSTIALRLCVEKYGKDNVHALSFDYGQKQVVELNKAHESCKILGVTHTIANLKFLGEISKGFSANIEGTSIAMPTIKDVLGDPAPVTYVPNRNLIMLSIASSLAEVKGVSLVVCGLQSRDAYGYWDTTTEFVARLNAINSLNRKHKITVCAPFNNLKKADEIALLIELDGNIDLLSHTVTCYNPINTVKGVLSCGKCPTCAERIKAFIDLKMKDPIEYGIAIKW